MELKGSRAVVTGGAVRIGRAVCRALAAKGCDPVIHYRRSEREAAELAGALKREFGADAVTVQGDFNSEAACERFMREVAAVCGTRRPSILVNNASVFHRDSLAASSEAVFMREFRPNFLAPLNLMRAFAAWHLGAQEDGDAPPLRAKIVNLLDRRITGNEPGAVPYLISKKALAELSRAAALELAPALAVCGVAPGAILPPSGGATGDGTVVDPVASVPLRRQCAPAEVAAAVVFCLECDALTGQIIYVDGGQHLLGT